MQPSKKALQDKISLNNIMWTKTHLKHSTQTKSTNPEEASSVITADNGYYNPNGDSFLSGDVVIDQSGRMIRADEVTIDKTQTFAKAKGNVQMAQGGIIAQSDQIDYNLKDETEKIERTSPTNIILENATYTTCPPDEKPTWKIQANKIELDQDTGRGVTRGTKLYVKDVPVLAVPYFNFPIDDRRTTGILSPSFGFTNDGGFELAVPVYLNLAPNYDATITPRLITDRGLMAQGEFRYLTENFGAGSVWGSYLPSDRDYNDEDRKDLHFLHKWDITKQWSTNLEYNYVSDKDFFSDLDSNPNSRTELNQRRAWELNYNHGIPGLKAQLKVEDFQTLDKTIKDVDKPYARLPQFLLNYVAGNPQAILKSDLDQGVAEATHRLQAQKKEIPPQNILQQQVLSQLITHDAQLEQVKLLLVVKSMYYICVFQEKRLQKRNLAQPKLKSMVLIWASVRFQIFQQILLHVLRLLSQDKPLT
ncbi:unnamed protein product [Oppiella nova]|uniref:LPS-assembly protein LptD n=1 Tax=Oppiella nova TaxID=334625 RepID=A0A7R9L7I1_9ACAR|nr:unnamed protein product [Oppiella nova]CAG2157133.1 unnamed protein product [Oppiella nova]